MKGSHHIIAETSRLKYEFHIRRNITVIRGDSATGKTTLIGLLQAYGQRGRESGVSVTSDVPCRVYSGDRDGWRDWIRAQRNSIIFIDEDYPFIQSEDFAATIQGSSNYYVLITRRSLVNLPYSVNEIYGIRTSGKYHFPQQIYHEFYRIYSDEYGHSVGQTVLITEDSGAGLQFYQKSCQGITCVSTNGNSNIKTVLQKYPADRAEVVIADGAAFGIYIENVLMVARSRGNVTLCLPESFEWMILRSGVIGGTDVSDILDHPEDYIESSRYFSWEQFFTEQLEERTAKDSLKRYNKNNLADYYTGAHVADGILSVLPENVRREIGME